MIDVFIHIGSPKTGTTAIQQFLTRHRDSLAEQGVLYPMGGVLRSAHHLIGAAVYPSRASRLGNVSRDDALALAIAQIANEIAERKPHTVILSTEYLWGELSAANIRRLLEPFRDMRIRIIAYVRRQDLLAQSLYVQAVKGGYIRSFRDWLSLAVEGEKAGFHLDTVLRGWRDSGIPAEVVARVYEKGQIEDDIRADFMKTVCPEVRIEHSPESPGVNMAPDMMTVELLRVVSTCLEEPEIANQMRRQIIARNPPRARFAPLAYLTAPEVADFMTLFAAGNERVAREFLGRSDGMLFRQPLPTGQDEPPARSDDGTLLRHLIAMLPNLVAPSPARHALAPRAPLPSTAMDAAARKKARKKARAANVASERSGA